MNMGRAGLEPISTISLHLCYSSLVPRLAKWCCMIPKGDSQKATGDGKCNSTSRRVGNRYAAQLGERKQLYSHTIHDQLVREQFQPNRQRLGYTSREVASPVYLVSVFSYNDVYHSALGYEYLLQIVLCQ